MLKKIHELQHYGLFHSGTPTPLLFSKVTLIYGENSRGKSTISSLLHACSQGDASKVLAMKTIDANETDKIKISFLCEINGKTIRMDFNKDIWNHQLENLVVFDANFVEQNIYSGHEVRTEQCQSLLEFALGAQAVALKKKIDALTITIGAAAQRRSLAEKEIIKYSQKTSLSQFINLAPVPDAQQQIEKICKKIEAAKNHKILSQRQDPISLPHVEFDITAFFEILGKTLIDIQESAELIVQQQLALHVDSSGFENWLSQGQAFSKDDDCPFCGQNITNTELIKAYNIYFNQGYINLKKQVSILEHGVINRLSKNKIDQLTSSIATNTACIDAWKDQLEITAPTLPLKSLQLAIKTAHDCALNLATKKQSRPLESFDSEMDRNIIANALDEAMHIIKTYNQTVLEAAVKISEFKQKLSMENITLLEQQKKSLELTMARYESATIKAIKDYNEANVEHEKLNLDKKSTRTKLDTLMNETLALYEKYINNILEAFGASFNIKKMTYNYQGGKPRTEYMLSFRQKEIPLGNRTVEGPHFGSILSEGDKRLLAFAFFLAQLEIDSNNLAGKIIVLDDPVSSFDLNRRAQTIEKIVSLSSRCIQIIVLSHDAHFIREIRDQKVLSCVSVLEIIRVQNNYSALSNCDIDSICASDYYRHYSLMIEYINGTHKGDKRDVAKSIRPLIEGYYHKKFPKLLPRGGSFGKIIDAVKNAAIDNPLVHLQSHLNEISAVNEYASRFHHDTNPGYSTAIVMDGELLIYANRALNLIYKS